MAVLIVLCGLAGCGRRDIPVDVYIEDHWSDEEEAAMVRAIDEWNRTANEYLKDPGPILTYRGRHSSRFSVDVFQDDVHVIYRIGSEAEIPEFMRDDPPGGYGTMEDMLLFTFNLAEGNDSYLEQWLEAVTLHELGHFLGLPHFESEVAVMNGEGLGALHLNEADIRQFCIAYECRKQP